VNILLHRLNISVQPKGSILEHMERTQVLTWNAEASTLFARLKAMLYGYFAVSGDQEQSASCCLCGYIAEADDWASFDQAWKKLLVDSGNGFEPAACLYGTDVLQSGDIVRRQALLADLSGVIACSALSPIGAFVVRDHFSGLSSDDRALLAAEDIQSPLDVIFYDSMEQIINHVHEESEKISLLLDQESQSAAERYNRLFNKHLNRYLLGPHLMGALTFGNSRSCSPLQAAKLLGEAVLLVEAQELFPDQESASISEALQQMAEPIRKQGRFHAEDLRKLAGRLCLKPIRSTQDPSA